MCCCLLSRRIGSGSGASNMSDDYDYDNLIDSELNAAADIEREYESHSAPVQFCSDRLLFGF